MSSEPLIESKEVDLTTTQSTKEQQLRRNKCALWVLGILAVLILSLTLVSMFAIRPLVDKMIDKQTLVDSPTAEGYATWAGEDVPDTYYDMWVWNVENPEAASNGSEKVRLREVGPYAFKEYRKKINVTFSDDGNIVSYYQWQYYVFDEERSGPGLSVNDTFLTGNVALQGVLYSSQLAPLEILPGLHLKEKLAQGLLCNAWENDLAPGYNREDAKFTPFVEVPVSDYFFGEKNEPVMTLLSHWVDNVNKDLSYLPFLHVQIPRVTTDFPGLGVLNLTSEEDTLTRSNINIQYTGKNNNDDKAQYIKWHNMTEVHVCPLPPPREGDDLVFCPHYQTEWTDAQAAANGWVPMWKNDEAMKIQGTDMIFWPRKQNGGELVGFVDPLFRWAKVTPEWDEEKSLPEFHNARGRRYTLRPKDMWNVTLNPDNDMYFDYGPNGLLNMTRKAGLPFFVSKPHFLDGDERLRNNIIGMHPDPTEHTTWFIKNELLGQTIAAHQTVQLNVLIQDWNFLNEDNCTIWDDLFHYWPCCSAEMSQRWSGSWKLNKTDGFEEGVYLPIVHIREAFVLTEAQAKKVNLAELMYNTVPTYAPVVGFSLFAVILFGMVVLYIQRRKIVNNDVYDDDYGVADDDIKRKLEEHYEA
jgi:hypothetical protein